MWRFLGHSPDHWISGISCQQILPRMRIGMANWRDDWRLVLGLLWSNDVIDRDFFTNAWDAAIMVSQFLLCTKMARNYHSEMMCTNCFLKITSVEGSYTLEHWTAKISPVQHNPLNRTILYSVRLLAANSNHHQSAPVILKLQVFPTSST
jgi:hypothetical protein